MARITLLFDEEKQLHSKEIETTQVRINELNEKIKDISHELLELQQQRDKMTEEVHSLEGKRNALTSRIEKTSRAS
ncbi:MAG: hypothetical protein MZV70_01465 [Desulfobacterales bacterium]|nr:hypothetical protein [Desulfobacterales bacterium]